MKKFRDSILTVLAVFAVSLVVCVAGPMNAMAATSPTLTDAASYSVLAGSIVTNVGATTVSGDLGISPSIGVAPHYTAFPPGIVGPPGVIHDADVSAAAAQADNTAAFGALNAGTNADANCIGGILADNTDLTTLSPLAPGVYCSAGSFRLTGNLTLTGTTGVWVFKTVSTLITSPGSSVTGGDPCNVWWRVGSSATLDTTTSFIGNILASTAITMNNLATLNGRAMTQTAAVNLNANTISAPVCTASSGGSDIDYGTINVVKTVINDNGGTKTVDDFFLFVNAVGVESGVTNRFNDNTQYTVHETPDPAYTATLSGDCADDGALSLLSNENKICIITNNDIGAPVVVPPVPPIIDVVKVPSPLALPNGPGEVTYTYTLTNIGTVPVTDVTMVGDTCSPIRLMSGDTDSDSTLDLNETWIYRCTSTLTETHTNTVTAMGWANGISATDIASATVVVGEELVPPLIHVTKVPSPLILPEGGGMVTYTEKVTNPGEVALSRVILTDDKCSPMRFISGDTNGDSKLDSTETWTYTCQTNLTETTLNTAVARGVANGITVRDIALATVVVPGLRPAAPTPVVPSLPRTGVEPYEAGVPWNTIVLAGLFSGSVLLAVIRRKQRN